MVEDQKPEVYFPFLFFLFLFIFSSYCRPNIL